MQFNFPVPPKYTPDEVNPPPAIKHLSTKLMSDILRTYESNYKLLKTNKHPDTVNVLKDPWFKREGWRYHPYYRPGAVIRRSFPGLAVASGAFIGYLAADHFGVFGREHEHHDIH